MAFVNRSLIISLTHDLKVMTTLCITIQEKYKSVEIQSWLFPLKSFGALDKISDKEEVPADKPERAYCLCLEFLLDRIYLFLNLMNVHLEKLTGTFVQFQSFSKYVVKPNSFSLGTLVNILWKQLLELEEFMVRSNERKSTLKTDFKYCQTDSKCSQTDEAGVPSCDSCNVSKKCMQTVAGVITDAIKFSHVEKAKNRLMTEMFNMTQFGFMNHLTIAIVADIENLVAHNQYLECSNRRCIEQNDKLCEEKDKLSEENGRLAKKIESLEREQEKLKRQKDRLQKKNESMEKEIERLHQERVKQHEGNERLVKEQTILKEDRTILKERSIILQDEIEMLQEKKAILLKEKEKLEITLNVLQEKRKTEAVTHKNKFEEYERTFRNLEELCKERFVTINNIRCENEELKGELSKCKEEITEVKSKIGDKVKNITDKEQNIKDKEQCIEDKEKIIKQQDEKIKELEKNLKEKEKILKEKEDSVTKKGTILKSQQETRIRNLSALSKNIKIKGDPLADMRNQIDLNKINIKVLEEENQSLSNTISSLQKLKMSVQR